MIVGGRKRGRPSRRTRRASGATRAAALALAAIALVAAPAGADPVTLRFASVAPNGSAWARELRAFGRDVATATQDEVHIKWYLSGIAGDELAVDGRVKRDQLDGLVSGGMLCQKLAPSLRAASLAGEFRDRDEARYVTERLRPTLTAELSRAGYELVAIGGMGFSILFSRTPVRTMAELRRLRPWLWDLDAVLKKQLGQMGLHVVPLPVETAGHAFDHGQVDSFLALPSAALAFQWTAQSRYVANLRIGYLTGCMLVAHRAWDALSHDNQQAIAGAVAKLELRLDDLSNRTDQLLLGGLLARQGVAVLPVSPAFQAEFSAAARQARAAVAPMAPPGAIARVAGWIEEYRNQHRGEKR